MNSPDLLVKYHKLAAEYSKLRAQNQVLKKAIVEEQSKTTTLKDGLKLREQSLRKAEQENDSLNFRNQQLTKRLILLQDDLEQLQCKPRKVGQIRLNIQANSENLDYNVYAEELELKIKENARLHAELADTEVFYKNRMAELEEKLESSNRNALQNSESIRAQEELFLNEVKKREMERILQEVTAQHKEAEMVVLQDTVKNLKFNVKSYMLNENREDGNSVNSSISLPFVDLNLKSSNKKIVKVPELILMKEFLEPIQQLATGFSNFLQSYFKLLNSIPTLSPIQSKFINQLNDGDKVWESMANNYKDISTNLKESEDLKLENLGGFDYFSKSVSKCSVILRKLLPVFSEKISQKEDKDDISWRSSWASFVACWAALSPYIASLAAHSEGRTILTSSAIIKILNLLSNRLIKLHTKAQELVVTWELFTSHEKQEDNISKSLQSIACSLNNISTIYCEKVVIYCSDETSNSSTPSSTVSPGTPQNSHHTGLSFLSSPDSNGWSGGVQDGCLQLADSEASLAQQLAHATSRLSKLEEEKDHWRLEFQLLNHKFEKECMKSHQFEESVKTNLSSKEFSNQDKVDGFSAASLIGELVGNSGSIIDREKEIRNHFTNRCSHLYMQLTSCTSQAALYQDECETLIRRMALCEESKSMLEHDLNIQRNEIFQLQENLSTTSRNYEEQISTMSEHLADLNEKITNQADFIEQLKFEINKKVKK